jgi:hypothetical protein
MSLYDESTLKFKVGDRVRVIGSGVPHGRIAGYIGPIGHKGAHLYAIRYRGGRWASGTQAAEDELELVERPEPKPPAVSPGPADSPPPSS